MKIPTYISVIAIIQSFSFLQLAQVNHVQTKQVGQEKLLQGLLFMSFGPKRSVFGIPNESSVMLVLETEAVG